MPLNRVRVLWQNWAGAPGYSNFYFQTGFPPPLAALRTFFEAIKTSIPTGLTLVYPAVGDVVNEETGQLTDAWSAAPPANTVGAASGAYAGAAGAVVLWKTSQVIHGRRPMGKTYLVPLSSNSFEATNGSLTSAFLSASQSAVDAFIASASPNFQVWHRPLVDALGNITRPGGMATVTSGSVPDMSAVMRSRRA